jgi:apolipoprotein D and lipocalin family protein
MTNALKLWRAAFAVLCLSGCALSAYSNNLPPLTTVASVDVPRYMGTWYEIAKYPNWFQKKCLSSTSATYSLGQARQLGRSDSPRLQVRFALAWLSFLPMVWGNYWIIDLDPQYQWVVVSEPSREYLWVLSRTPELPAAAYQSLLDKLAAKGFDLQRIQLSTP